MYVKIIVINQSNNYNVIIIIQCFVGYFQYITVPMRRSTAEAIQILILHALGDAGSPYLIGAVSIKTDCL